MGERQLRELVIATANPGKFGEIENALQNLPLMLRSLTEFPMVRAPQEDGNSYIENATIKAKYYSEITNNWALADDSGLEIDALHGEPGILSARFGSLSSDVERSELILRKLGTIEPQNRTAHFVCVISVANPATAEVHSFEGVVSGQISSSRRGTSGFGYDPIFIPEGYDQTFGELDPDVKSAISHRARALKKVRRFLVDCLERNS